MAIPVPATSVAMLHLTFGGRALTDLLLVDGRLLGTRLNVAHQPDATWVLGSQCQALERALADGRTALDVDVLNPGLPWDRTLRHRRLDRNGFPHPTPPHPTVRCFVMATETPTLAEQCQMYRDEIAQLRATLAAVQIQADAGLELAEYASYAEIVGAITHNRSAIRTGCDAVFSAHRAGENVTVAVAAMPPQGSSTPPLRGRAASGHWL